MLAAKNRILSLVLSAILLFLCEIVFLANFNDLSAQEIALQGILRNQSGRAVADGNYSLTFKMYDAETGGNQVWTETQPTVSVSQGIYSVYLGSVTNFENVAFDKQYWLGISINGGQELSPRVKLARNPYALGILGTSNVFTSNGNVGIGTTTPNNKLEVIGNAYLSGNLAIGQGSALTFNDGTSLTTGALSQVRSDQWVDFYVNKADNEFGNLHIRFGSGDVIKYGFSPIVLDAFDTFWMSNGHEINTDFGGVRQYLVFRRNNLSRWSFLTVNEQGGDGVNGFGGHDLVLQRHKNDGVFLGDHTIFRRNGTTVFGGGAIEDRVKNNNHKVKIINNDVADFGQQALNIDFGAGQFLEFWRAPEGSPTIENSGGHIVFGTWNLGDLERNVGIGDNTPDEAKLVVSGGPIKFFDNGWAMSSSGTGGNGTKTQVATIWATGTIHADWFRAFSDARIKNQIGISNSSQDLDLLNKIRITDYTYVDTVNNGTGIQKKVIAQEVEQILPTAVTKSKAVIPSIYAFASNIIQNEGHKSITVPKNHGLIKGDKVQLISRTTKDEKIVVEVIDNHTFVVESMSNEEELFVYGKFVDDFRSVDYDALSTLNISATQELHKMIIDLQNKVNLLEANKKELTSENQKLEARLDHIEYLVKSLSESKSTSKNVTANK